MHHLSYCIISISHGYYVLCKLEMIYKHRGYFAYEMNENFFHYFVGKSHRMKHVIFQKLFIINLMYVTTHNLRAINIFIFTAKNTHYTESK